MWVWVVVNTSGVLFNIFKTKELAEGFIRNQKAWKIKLNIEEWEIEE